MADGNDLQVKFGAETSAFNAGVQDVKAELGGLRGSLQTLVDGFLILGGAATGSFREIRTGAMEAHAQVKGLSEAMVEFREMLTGIGEALIAAFAVEQLVEFAKHMGEAGEKIEHTGLALGLTTDEVQGLQATASATGMSLDGVAGAAQRLERALGAAHTGTNKQSAAFKQLGIDIDVARTPAELFNEVTAKFAEMPPSLNKSQEAMALFGRNILEVAPLLGLTAEGMAEISRQTEAYGLKNANAVTQAAALGMAFNENKNAMQGVSNVLAEAFAPVLAEVVRAMNDLAASFIRSYKEGGTAKILVEGLAFVFKGLVAVVNTITVAFLELWHIAVGSIEAIIAPVYALGGALDAVLNGKGLSGGAAAFKSQMAQMSDSAKGHFAAAIDAGKGWLDFEGKLWSPRQAKPEANTPIKTTGDGQGDGKTPKGPDTWLQEQKTAFQEGENAHNEVLQNELQDELAFWQKLQDAGEVPAKHELDVKRRTAELVHQLRKEELAQEVADAHQAMADKDAAARDQLATRTAAIREEIKSTQDAARQHEISWQTASARINVLIGEEVAAQKKAAMDIFRARIEADDAIKTHYAENTTQHQAATRDQAKAWDEYEKARVKAETEANRAIADNNRHALDQMKQEWHGYINSSVQALGSGIKGMIEGTKSFRDVMLSLGDAILSTFINVGERLVENWLVDMITNRLASSSTAVAQVGANAAVAGSAAFASTAAIPIIGPELAPAAAAAAYAGALSFAPLAIAEGGWGNVPIDNAPTLLHKEEMVLPATLANPMRAMLTGSGAAAVGGGSPANDAGGKGGPVNIHIHTLDGPSTKRWLRDGGGDEIVSHLKRAHRNAALGA